LRASIPINDEQRLFDIDTAAEPLDVIILTKDRLDLLIGCLKSLEIAGRGFQIRLILGVNGATAVYKNQVDDLLRDLSYAGGHKIIDMEDCFPGAARNVLLSHATAAWALFCDDDVVLPPEIISNFHKVKSQFPAAAIFGGPNRTPLLSTVNERAQGYVLGSRFFTGPMFRRYNWGKSSSRAGATDLTLCNLFVKLSAGPVSFPQNFICGEELVLFKNFSGKLIVTDDLFVFHYRRKSLSEFFRQSLKYGLGRFQSNPASGFAVLSAVTMMVLAAFFAGTVPILLNAVVCYLLLLIIESVRLAVVNSDLFAILAVIKSAVVLHAGYLLGIIWGAIARLKKLLAVMFYFGK
jgi:hypothetical protein